MGPSPLTVAGSARGGDARFPARDRPRSGGADPLRARRGDAGGDARPPAGYGAAVARRRSLAGCPGIARGRSRGGAAPHHHRAHAAVDRAGVVRRRAGSVAAAHVRLARGAAPGEDGHAPRAGGLPGGARAPGGAPPRLAPGARPRVSGRAGPRRRRLAPSGDPPPGERVDGTYAPAARRAARARAGARAALRLPGEPRAVGDRDTALLPPCGAVGVATRARGARALLRRPGRGRVRRRPPLREGPPHDGEPPRQDASARALGGGNAGGHAARPGPAVGGAHAGRTGPALDGRCRRRDAAARARRRRCARRRQRGGRHRYTHCLRPDAREPLGAGGGRGTPRRHARPASAGAADRDRAGRPRSPRAARGGRSAG